MSANAARERIDPLQRAYVWLLPWLGYLALLMVPGAPIKPAQLTGWALVLVWEILVLGALAAQVKAAGRPPWHRLWMLAPALLTLTQTWSAAGTAVINLCLELTITEFAALIATTVVLMLRKPGEDKSMAWPGIIILTLFCGAYLYALLRAWQLLNHNPDWLRWLALGTAFASQCAVDWRWLSQAADGRIQLVETMDSDHDLFRVVGQILLWLLLPLPFLLH